MVAGLLLTCFALFTLHYVFFLTRVRLGLARIRKRVENAQRPFVSVVVAARNEEGRIRPCLDSLLRQSYPSDRYEIIVADDGSTDRTAEIVRDLSYTQRTIRLHTLERAANLRVGRKPQAVAEGVNLAKAEIICTTDADCIVPPRWLERMVQYLGPDVAFASGPVVEEPSGSAFAAVSNLEYLGLTTIGAGLIGAGRPITCSGANLAYRKSAFLAAMDNSVASSNDDEALMNRIQMRNLGKIVFVPEPDAVVRTPSSGTIGSFLRQRIRWAGKRGHYEDRSILLILVALYLFFVSFLAATLSIPYEPGLALPVGIVFLGKIIADFFTLRAGARMLGEHVPTGYFLIAEVLHVPYVVVAAALGQLAPFRWKGRTLHR
ncbi:MAG: glycosyltransferase [Bacteroidota bacterium]